MDVASTTRRIQRCRCGRSPAFKALSAIADAFAVSWPLPNVQDLHPTVRGGRAQWMLEYGSVPPLLELLGASPSWFFAWIRARQRAFGGGAGELFAWFNDELGRMTGHTRVALPTQRCRAGDGGAKPLDWAALPAPAHRALKRAFVRAPAAQRRVIEPLLDAAFGTRASPLLDARARARLCALGSPPALVAAWRDTQDIPPPLLFEPPERLATEAVITAGFADAEEVAPVDLPAVGQVLPLAIDAVAMLLTVRLTLRAAGLLLSDESAPIQVTARAA